MDRLGRPLLMRTYGKQSRRIDAWLSPDNRRGLFDSASDETTTSLTTKPARNRPNDKKGKAASRYGVRKAKAKAMECLRMEDSDPEEESFATPRPPASPMQQRNKPLRKGDPVSKPAAAGRTAARRKAQRALSTSESDGDPSKENSAPKRPRGTVCRPRRRPDRSPDVSLGRFVTRRRGAAATTTKAPKSALNALAPAHNLDSSADFVRGGGRRTGGRAAFPRRAKWASSSSAESSAAEPGGDTTSGALGACLREASSLDSSAEPGMAPPPRHRRPLFCSTPSLRALARRPSLRARRLRHPCPSPSVSVIEISSLSVTQEEMEVDPPEDPLRPSPRAPVGVPGPGAKRLSDPGEPRGDLGGTNGQDPPPQLGAAAAPRSRGSLNGGAGSPNDGAEIQNGRPEPTTSPELFSLAAGDQTQPDGGWEETEGGGRFASAAGRLEGLAEDVKKMCVARRCVVVLERWDRAAADVTGPRGETSYWSCIDLYRSCTENRTGSPKRSSSATCGGSADRSGAGVKLRSANIVNVLERTREEGVLPEDEARADGAPAGGRNVPADHVPADASRGGVPKAGRTSGAGRKGKRGRSVSKSRLASTRKACVSGLSVSRWSRREERAGPTAPPRAGRAEDCSITELLSTRPLAQAEAGMQSWLQASGAGLCTPVRAGRLQLSLLLQDLTPDTHTWSRLKAALSVHKKTKAFLTPFKKVMDLSLGGAGLADVSQDLFNTPLSKSRPQHLQSQLQKSILSVSEDELSDAEKVYAECGQQGALGWEACLPPGRMKLCRKIGEGTFGEVFSTTNSTGDTVALKIIPVEGGEKVNGEEQKTFGEILHEIIISKELSSLKEKAHNQTHGFIGLNDLHCVRGRYPPALLKAWDAFDRQRRSENDRPDFFEDDQLFLILEFEFGGSDLENSNGKLSSLAVAKSILHQVTAALAVAEQELHFEHRDLHWGNVLVKTTTEEEGCFLLNGVAHRLDTRGVHVRIIDYSLSRLEIDGLTVSCDISEDEELFMGKGDYQFDIYRLMRQENSNDWSVYQPHSNVLWLHYLSSKLLAMKFRGRGRGVKQARQDLDTFQGSVLQYGSATEALHGCALFQSS